MNRNLRKLDYWGTTTSLLCAIHCALLPVLISYGYVKASALMSHPLLEVLILGTTAVLVYLSILKPYLQNKEKPLPFYLAIGGIILILTHHMIPFGHSFVIILGGLMIASSHLLNLKESKSTT